MSDDAYIPPSEREFDIEDCYEIDAFGSECHGIEKLRASHAVVDSVAADLADALRPLLEIERYNLPQCTEADTGGCHYAKECVGGCGTDEAWETYCKHRAALARYDALHKEAGQ